LHTSISKSFVSFPSIIQINFKAGIAAEVLLHGQLMCVGEDFTTPLASFYSQDKTWRDQATPTSFKWCQEQRFCWAAPNQGYGSRLL